jgi:hypothetical protein
MIVAMALRNLGIAHHYEAWRIDLSLGTYLPDFYLPKLDVHIEVKGWKNKRFMRILRAIEVERPDLRLLLIEQPEIDLLKCDARNLEKLLEPYASLRSAKE